MFERYVTRAVAFASSALVTLTIVSALASTADLRYTQACQAAARNGDATQQVLVVGQRLPRS